LDTKVEHLFQGSTRVAEHVMLAPAELDRAAAAVLMQRDHKRDAWQQL